MWRRPGIPTEASPQSVPCVEANPPGEREDSRDGCGQEAKPWTAPAITSSCPDAKGFRALDQAVSARRCFHDAIPPGLDAEIRFAA
jgi:hypothetical protein